MLSQNHRGQEELLHSPNPAPLQQFSTAAAEKHVQVGLDLSSEGGSSTILGSCAGTLPPHSKVLPPVQMELLCSNLCLLLLILSLKMGEKIPAPSS